MNALFWVAVGIMLIPVWTNTYFLTGDGPTHVYNARVLCDWLTTGSDTFYSKYYFLNTHADPNWLGHVGLSLLLSVLPGYLAEKIFLTIYILSYALSLRWLLITLNRKNVFLVFLGLPFVFFYTFQMGFYNYSLSFVLLFINLAFVFKYSDAMRWRHVIVLTLLNIALYFAHPIGWLIWVMAMIVLLLQQGVSTKAQKNVRGSKSFEYAILAGFPSTILMVQYLLCKGVNPTPNPDSAMTLFRDFIELDGLVTMTTMENAWAAWMAILFGCTFLYVLVNRVKSKTLERSDVFFVLFVVTLCVYFFQPGGMSGAGILSIRLQLIPYLMMLLWCSSATFDKWIKATVMIGAFVLGSILIVVRFPHYVKASEAVEELVSVDDFIEEFSIVLPLSFSHNGKTPDGAYISKRIWLFMHAADYLGADKPLILLGNYEANTGYFPLIWKDDFNPFRILGRNGGIEHQPPGVDIVNFEDRTNEAVGYVIMWCLDDQYRDHENTVFLQEQLTNNYTLIFTSKHGRALLYKRNPRNSG